MPQTYALLLLGRTVGLGTRFLYCTAIQLLVSASVPVIQLTCPRYAQSVTWTIYLLSNDIQKGEAFVLPFKDGVYCTMNHHLFHTNITYIWSASRG